MNIDVFQKAYTYLHELVVNWLDLLSRSFKRKVIFCNRFCKLFTSLNWALYSLESNKSSFSSLNESLTVRSVVLGTLVVRWLLGIDYPGLMKPTNTHLTRLDVYLVLHCYQTLIALKTLAALINRFLFMNTLSLLDFSLKFQKGCYLTFW